MHDASTSPAPKRALVICYSPVGRDARVTKQIGWLESAGYTVDVLSREPEHPLATGRKLRIGQAPLLSRIFAHVALPPRVRFRWLVERKLPHEQFAEAHYDTIVVNDHHVLPWAVHAAPQLTAGPVVLDLHEVYADSDSSWLYRFLIADYDEWLLQFITSEVFTRRLTVAEGIADLYQDEYGVPRPVVIRNVAPYVDLTPSPVDPDRIVLVHHGYAARERGIDLMLDAALELEDRFVLRLMVVGSEHDLQWIRKHPAVVSGRAELRPPVPVGEVAYAINDCDLEVIFMPPKSLNKIYALPNKFFEAVQARLGVVVGRSREIVPYVQSNGLGTIVEGWTASDLAAAVNALTAEEITAMKQAAAEAASELSTQVEGPRFLAQLAA